MNPHCYGPKLCRLLEWLASSAKSLFQTRLASPARLLSLLSFAVLLIPPSAFAYETRVNCGAGSYDSPATGYHYFADQAYTGTGWGYERGFALSNWLGQAVGGTYDPPLYWGAHLGSFGFEYRFEVPASTYDVTLRGVDISGHWQGFNAMSLVAEGQTVFDNLDIFAEVERGYALDVRIRVPVSDGRLDLEFIAELGFAQVAGIEVLTAESVPGPPAGVENLVLIPGYASLILNWDDNDEADLRAYEVSRRVVPLGAWQVVQPASYLTSRFIDEEVVEGLEYAYEVTAHDLDGMSSAASFVSGQSRNRSASSLRDYELTLTEPNLTLLNDDIWSDDYVPADFAWDSLPWPGVGVRYRGQSNRNGPKKNWKVRFYDDEIESMDRLNLNSGYADPSLIREALGFRIGELTGTYGCRTERVNLYLNGKHRGIHTQIEQVDGNWLDFRGLDGSSAIFKCNDGLHLQPSGLYSLFYDRKTGPEEDLQPIIDLIETIHLSTDEEFPAAISQLVDLHEFTNWYAALVLMGNKDFATHNFYAILDGETGRWSFVIWDLDVSLGSSGSFLFDFDETSPIDIGTFAHPDVRGSNALIDRFLTVPKFQWMYAQRLLDLLDGDVSLSSYLQAFESEVDDIAADVAADFHKWGWESPLRQSLELDQVETYIRERHDFLRSEAASYQPNFDFPIRINEFLASNDSSHSDEEGEFDDWIELFNSSAAPVSLGGLWLSDDLSEPLKWALPDTVLAVNEYLIIWADDDPEQGPLHAPFKLSAGGEAVALWDEVEEGNILLDYIEFGPQATDISMGRIPDGIGSWTLLDPPSPGTTNGPPSAVDSDPPAHIATRSLRVFPNPASGRVTFELADAVVWGDQPVILGLFDAAGRQIAELPLTRGASTVHLDQVLSGKHHGLIWARPLGRAGEGVPAEKFVWISSR